MACYMLHYVGTKSWRSLLHVKHFGGSPPFLSFLFLPFDPFDHFRPFLIGFPLCSLRQFLFLVARTGRWRVETRNLLGFARAGSSPVMHGAPFACYMLHYMISKSPSFYHFLLGCFLLLGLTSSLLLFIDIDFHRFSCFPSPSL